MVLLRGGAQGRGRTAVAARRVAAVNPGNRPTLPFQRLTRPPRRNPAISERFARQRPISFANGCKSQPARPIRKTYPPRRWREQLAEFVDDPERANGYSPSLSTIAENDRSRHHSPVHLPRSTSSSDQNYPGFGKYSLMMCQVS